jgi:hypothetical protein
MAEDKDLDLLGIAPSPWRTDSITERIARLRCEITRGETVYTAGEIRALERQLEEYERLLEMIQHR